MKKIFSLVLCIVAINLSAQDSAQPQVELKNQLDSLNYFFGLTMGYSLETAPFETNSELISTGLVQAVNKESMYDFDYFDTNVQTALNLEDDEYIKTQEYTHELMSSGLYGNTRASKIIELVEVIIMDNTFSLSCKSLILTAIVDLMLEGAVVDTQTKHYESFQRININFK